MIRVTVELVSGSGSRELARMDISNLSPGEKTVAEYGVQAVTILPNGDTRITQRGVHGYKRRAFNVWGLVFFAIKAMGRDIITISDGMELPE